MNASEEIDISDLEISDSWGRSVTDNLERSARTAWLVAIVAAIVALLEAIALVWLIPLKTVEPYTLLVDRQTGNVEALAPLDAQMIAPDAALTRSFLVQYVIARESFDIDNLQSDYRKVALWSAGEARERYLREMQAGSPGNPLSYLPRRAVVKTEIVSVSSLGADRSMVRFMTTQTDPGGQPMEARHWVALITYQFSDAAMSEADRYMNPLGFQVTRYRKDAETLPEPGREPSQAPTPARKREGP